MKNKLNDLILKRKRNKMYYFPKDKDTLNIGCEYRLLDSEIGIDGSFLIYLIKSNFPMFIKRWIYNKSCTSNYISFNNFLKTLNKKDIIHHDILYGIPFWNNCVSNIYSSHFIEHLTKEQGIEFLGECWNVLKDGGTIKILSPLSDKGNDFEERDSKLISRFAFHRHIYNLKEIKDIFIKIGFKDIKESKDNKGFIIEAKKEARG